MANTILPPRNDQRAFADAAALPVISIYEETGSLRPTWLPRDPSSYPPPTLRSREPQSSRLIRGAQIAGLLFATWGLAFGGVVGSQVVRAHFAKRAAASASVSAAVDVVSSDARAAHDSASRISPVADGSAATKTVDSGIVLTVDVNDLPVSKDLPARAKGRGVSRGRAAGS